MTKNNVVIVIAVMAISLGLVFGLSAWLGGGAPSAQTAIESNATKTVPEEMTSEEETKPAIQAPLAPDQLAAYQVTMTNDKNPVAVFTTNKGIIELELFEDTMPITVGNFIELAEKSFYNGVKFHRVIEGFMIQSGDPISKTNEFLRYGTGGPGYSIPDEHVKGQYLSNVRGTIAMANSGPNSGGSQFFINVADNTPLDFDKEPLSSKHPVFGRVLRGMEVVDTIAQVETNQNDMPLEHVVIESVLIKYNN